MQSSLFLSTQFGYGFRKLYQFQLSPAASPKILASSIFPDGIHPKAGKS
jgi:hypothetical protein